MGAVRMLAGFEIRRRGWRVAVLTLLVGVVGAVVLATMAGARRSESALARFNASSRVAQLELTVGDATASQLEAFGRAKGVESFAPLLGVSLQVRDAPQVSAVAEALDTRFGTLVDRPRVISGRSVDPTKVDEVTIGEALAQQLHLVAGDRLDAQASTPEEIEKCFAVGAGCSGATKPDGPRFRLRIVGIVRRPLDLGDRGAAGGVLIMTPAFAHQTENKIGSYGGMVLRVRTRNGAADVARVAAAARRIFSGSAFGVQDLAIDTQGAQSAIDVLTLALWVFAGVAALAGLVALTIVLSREISLTAIDQTTQTALGLTRPQRIAVSGFLAVPMALGGALFAVVAAAAASPLFPIGVARRAEPDPGLRIDTTVLVLGTVVVAGGILLIGFLGALRTTRQSRAEDSVPRRVTSVAGAATRAGLTPVATTGVRMALEPGRGPTTVPVRSAMFGVIFGVLGVVAVLMFASSLDHLVATPARYGWTWDFAAIPDDPSVFDPQAALFHAPGIAALAELDTVNVQLDGRPASVWGFTPLRGTIGPEIIAGRAPVGPDEIALGSATLDELGKKIGGTVHGVGPDGKHDFRIVGRAVFSRLDSPQPLANGGAITGAGLARLLSETDTHNGSPYIVGRVAAGAHVAAVEHRVAAIPNVEPPFGPSLPVEVDRLQHVNWLPTTLAALLTVLAVLAVGHALVTSVRRRRRDLAVLKTLGFDRGQVRATIAWQATTLATVGLLIGIPVGIIIGKLVWRLVANGLGVATNATTPTLGILLTVAGALAVVNLIAFLPARAAAQTRPAVVLRSE